MIDEVKADWFSQLMKLLVNLTLLIINTLIFTGCENNRELEQQNMLLKLQLEEMKRENEKASQRAADDKARRIEEEKEDKQKKIVRECVDGLRKFKVATEVGVSYRDFAGIIKEVRLIIEPIVDKIEDLDVQKRVHEILNAYMASYTMWTNNNTEDQKVQAVKNILGGSWTTKELNAKYARQQELSNEWGRISGSFVVLDALTQ